tara:strand:+ start:752 stop:1003 length:252 start_codon:yes stop_codon:yes gene_type:complete
MASNDRPLIVTSMAAPYDGYVISVSTMSSVVVISSLDEQDDIEVDKRITILKRYVFIEDYFWQTRAKISKCAPSIRFAVFTIL